MSRIKDLKYIILTCCEKGYRPIAPSKVEEGRFIVLIDKTIDLNGYFSFNYADENGNLLTDSLPSRKSIYPINHYQWLYLTKDNKLLRGHDVLIASKNKLKYDGSNDMRKLGCDIKYDMRAWEHDGTEPSRETYDYIGSMIPKTQEMIEIENLKKEIEIYKNMLKNNNISIPKNIGAKVVGIDFDGTLVTNQYPDLGVIKENAKKVCQKIVDSGNQIVIWTCREPLVIKDFLLENDIPFNAINENTEVLTQRWGNDPRKVGVDLFIDDKNIFCHEINWFEIENELIRLGYIKE